MKTLSQRSADLQGGSLCVNDASATVKHTTVLAFCVPVYMPADTGNTTGSESEQAMGYSEDGGHRVSLCR